MKGKLTVAIILILVTWATAQNRNGIPLGVGDSVPAVYLNTLEGKGVKLVDEINSTTSVIIFYRGGWCPFCNAHLSDLQDINRALRRKGVKIMAISPEPKKGLEKTKETNDLDYDLYTDTDAAAVKFGVATLVNGKPTLPTPSVFIVDTKGVVQFVHFDPDYKVRLEARIILEKVESIIKR